MIPAPRKVLIAGCGYVGGALAQLLAGEGQAVHALRRSARAMGEGVHTLQADLVSGKGLDALPADLDTVFYTTGADSFSEEAYRNAYVVGLRNLVARLGSKPRLIYTSSTGVYAHDAGEWVDENSETRPTKFSGTILLEGEAAVRESGLEATVVRFGGIYGPGRTRLIDQVRSGTAYTLAGRTQYLNLIHRDDCAGILRHLMLLDSPAPLYCGVDTEPLERGELLGWMANRLGVRHPPAVNAGGQPDPQRGGNRRVSSARLRASGYTFRYPTAREGYGAMIDAGL